MGITVASGVMAIVLVVWSAGAARTTATRLWDAFIDTFYTWCGRSICAASVSGRENSDRSACRHRREGRLSPCVRNHQSIRADQVLRRDSPKDKDIRAPLTVGARIIELQPASGKACPTQTGQDWRATAHDLPQQSGAMILDHQHHRTLIDTEVIRRNPPAGRTAFYGERSIE